MKKVLVLMLALCMVLTACGSSSDRLSLEQFEAKYKRADWKILNSSPMEFLDDLNRMSGQPLDDWCPSLDSFTVESNGPTTNLEKEMILFNRPARFRGLAFIYPEEKKFFSGNISMDGTAAECYETFLTMFETGLKSKGDAYQLKIGTEEVDEVTFRKAISSGDEDSLSVYWNTGETDRDPLSGVFIYIISDERAIISFH